MILSVSVCMCNNVAHCIVVVYVITLGFLELINLRCGLLWGLAVYWLLVLFSCYVDVGARLMCETCVYMFLIVASW